jgi:ferredoxin
VKITVDEDRCCGAGQCVMTAPDVFDQREEDGIVVLLDPSPPDDRRPVVRNAEAMCPAAAITVED